MKARHGFNGFGITSERKLCGLSCFICPDPRANLFIGCSLLDLIQSGVTQENIGELNKTVIWKCFIWRFGNQLPA